MQPPTVAPKGATAFLENSPRKEAQNGRRSDTIDDPPDFIG